MIKIAICDDDILTTANVETLIQNISVKKIIKIEIDVFYDGRTLVDYIKKGNKYDLIYLDIEMKDLDGVETGRKIRLIDKGVLIIYVTNHEGFAKDVFEVSAFRFITKPIDNTIFERYFMDAQRNIMGSSRFFRYQYNKTTYRVSIDEIVYFQSDRRITYIITRYGSEKCYGKLNDIEKKLVGAGVYFYRTHQSFLVNPRYVFRYTYDTMELTDGTILAISEHRRKKVNELFCMLKGDDIIV